MENKNSRIYRGKSADGVWYEGFLIRSPGVKENRPGEGWYINSENETPYKHLVMPITVGMTTGLLDETGKMVFEGDIVETSFPEKSRFVVSFGSYKDKDVQHLGFFADFMDGRDHRQDIATYIERGKVIGNICDDGWKA